MISDVDQIMTLASRLSPAEQALLIVRLATQLECRLAEIETAQAAEPAEPLPAVPEAVEAAPAPPLQKGLRSRAEAEAISEAIMARWSGLPIEESVEEVMARMLLEQDLDNND